MRACDFDRYVGLPFKDQGRTREGVDCWGLLRLVYAEQAGVMLPSYSDKYTTAVDDAAVAALVAGRTEPWREIPESQVRPLDGVLMVRAGHEGHIGVVVKRGLVLHVSPGGTSLIESYNSLRLKRRVSRFMRYEGNTQSP